MEEIETLVKDYYRLRGWSAERIPPDVGSIGTVQSNKKEMHIFMTPFTPYKSSVSGEEFGRGPGRTSSHASTTKSGTAPPPTRTLIMDSVESRLMQPP